LAHKKSSSLLLCIFTVLPMILWNTQHWNCITL